MQIPMQIWALGIPQRKDGVKCPKMHSFPVCAQGNEGMTSARWLLKLSLYFEVISGQAFQGLLP